MSEAEDRSKYVSGGDGYVEIVPQTWSDLVLLFGTKEGLMKLPDRLIWRGQQNVPSWKLQPAVNRLAQEKSRLEDRDEREKLSRELFKAFKLAARGVEGMPAFENVSPDKWWAVGRHAGLATPLLDWTRSPFVAAFFACEDEPQGGAEGRAIYGLSVEAMEKVLKTYCQSENGPPFCCPSDNGNCVCVLPETLVHDKRLASQGSVFTQSFTEKDIKSWVNERFRGNSSAVLIKVVLKEEERVTALRALNLMNINHKTLFADASGAAKYANMCARVEGYE